MHTLDDVLGVVTAQRTKIDSLSALISGMKKRIDEALGGQLTPSQQMRVDRIFNEAQSNTEAIDQAIVANTDEDETKTLAENLIPTKTTVTSSNSVSNVGDKVTVSAGVIKAAVDAPAEKTLSGQVVFKVDGNAVGTAQIDSTGVAAISSSDFPGMPLTEGDHKITASFSGSRDFAPSDSDEVTQTVGTTGTVAGDGTGGDDTKSQRDAANAGERDGAGNINKLPTEAPRGPTEEWPGDESNYGNPTTQTRPTRPGLPDTIGVPNAGASGAGGQTTPPGQRTNAPGEMRTSPSGQDYIAPSAPGVGMTGPTTTTGGSALDFNTPSVATRDDGGQVGRREGSVHGETLRADGGKDFVDPNLPPSPAGVDLGNNMQKGKGSLDPDFVPGGGNPSIAGATSAAGAAGVTGRPVPQGGGSVGN